MNLVVFTNVLIVGLVASWIASLRFGGRTRGGAALRGTSALLFSLVLTGWACAQTLDSFNPGANYAVYALTVQPDGAILVGGQFTTLGGQACGYIGRLTRGGSVESAFSPGADGYVNELQYMAQSILAGQPPTTVTAQDALSAVEICEAEETSIRTNRVVPL